MLTKSERQWVIENKTRNGCIYARRCRYTCFEPPYCPVIPTKEDLIDALEFEGRVAAKLATEHEKIMLNGGVCEECFARETCFNGFKENDNALCSFEMLKAARLQVEEEMDG